MSGIDITKKIKINVNFKENINIVKNPIFVHKIKKIVNRGRR